MNKFEKQLEKWNNGILRGAQAKLAKVLGVSTATTALWTTGKRRPSKGYIAQMASLFSLDTYHTLKLFEMQPSVIYPEPIASKNYVLRDKADNLYGSYTFPNEDETLSQSNTVQIPFVLHITPSAPYYKEEDIVEWWRLPRRYAQGTKYLVSSQYLGISDANSTDDLCFVKPGTEINHQSIILFTNGKGKFMACQALIKQHAIQYLSYPTLKPVSVSKQFYPIGQLVKRIKPL